VSIPWHDNGLHDRRVWLGQVQPIAQDEDECAAYALRWGPDCDQAITARRRIDHQFDAPFALAEQQGIAIVPAYRNSADETRPHLLMEMAYSCDDTDWIVVTRQGTPQDCKADVMVEGFPSVLTASTFERHTTPTWCIRITNH
jgi:hypothetical protein